MAWLGLVVILKAGSGTVPLVIFHSDRVNNGEARSGAHKFLALLWSNQGRRKSGSLVRLMGAETRWRIGREKPEEQAGRNPVRVFVWLRVSGGGPLRVTAPSAQTLLTSVSAR